MKSFNSVFVAIAAALLFSCSNEEIIDNPNDLKGFYTEGRIRSVQAHSLSTNLLDLNIFFLNAPEGDYSKAINFGEGSFDMYDYIGVKESIFTASGSATVIDSTFRIEFISGNKLEISSKSERVLCCDGESYPCKLHEYQFKEGCYYISEAGGYNYFYVNSNSVVAKKDFFHSDEKLVFKLKNYIYFGVSDVNFSSSKNFKKREYKQTLHYKFEKDDNILFWNNNMRIEGAIDIYTMEITLKQTYPIIGDAKKYKFKKK